MKATEAKLLQFLKKSPQFIIPIYQRTYSWTERECRQLWDDLLRAGANDKSAAHFVGSIVYIEQGLYHVSSESPLLVIDGQQRLTTVTLVLEALARHLGDREVLDGQFSAEKIRSYYLLNPLEKGERGFKLVLTQTDKASLLAVVQQKPQPSTPSIRVAENFAFFEAQVKRLGAQLDVLCRGLDKLMIVDVALSRGHDNPQLIFESMNSTGRELSQADLIRNYVLMGLEPVHQTMLYEDYWRPMEVGFGQEAYGEEFDSFMRHYLTLKTGEIPNVRAVYEAFKAHAQKPEIAALGVDALVADIRAFAEHYCAMAMGQEPDKDLAAAFQDLRDMRVDVAYPFLLELYHDYKSGTLSRDDFHTAARVVESYVFRRAICAIPTNSQNKTFATIGRLLNKDRYLDSVCANLLRLPSYRRFPNDDEFKQELMRRDLYTFPRRSYWLRRLENYGRKERVPVDEYTIEHILPQNKDLPAEWREALGPEWQRVQETFLHTLGNLTLTGYNSEYSDRPFKQKRDMKGGFKESPLRVNEGLGALDTWNEATIRARAERLAEVAAGIWALPTAPADLLAIEPRGESRSAYSVDHFPHLSEGSPMRQLFEEFRVAVKALDPGVTEEFLKLYIAFKAETNFVDVVPQAKRLRLSVNLKFHELHDPQGRARDLTNISRWGNGDVEIGFSTSGELPYVMGLVRQAFEKQMGEASTS